jgi:hypothetical protein
LPLVAAVSPVLTEAAWFSPRPPDPSSVERLDLSVPNYAWWHGCTPTYAGMLMGYYDRIANGGLNHILSIYTAPSENGKWSIWVFGYVAGQRRAKDEPPFGVAVGTSQFRQHRPTIRTGRLCFRWRSFIALCVPFYAAKSEI